MTMNVNAQTIELYMKQLRTPTFNRYEDVRQLGLTGDMRIFWLHYEMELDSRMESSQRQDQAAGFPTSRLWTNWTLVVLNT